MPNSGKWNGEERRQYRILEAKDHDTLIEMCQIMKNHVDNFNGHVDNFKVHEIRDEKNHAELKRENLLLQRSFWIGLGALATLQYIPTILKLMHIINQ